MTASAEDEARYGPQLDDLHEEELRGLRAEGSKRKPAKPTGHLCVFCVPIVLRKPSGPRLCHSLFCPSKPGELIHVGAYAKGREWKW